MRHDSASHPKALVAELIRKRGKVLAALAIVVIIAVVAGVWQLWRTTANGRTLKVSGTIEGNDVRISFRVGGQIEQLLADEGTLLRTGDIVARLNKDELSREKREADAALKLARAQYELDRLNHVRAENLFNEGAISAQQRDAAKTLADTDMANIEQLAAAAELAAVKLGWADLASPLNGYIIVKSALQGEVVQTGAPVFTAVDLNDIWVSAYVNETDLGKIKLNQPAHIMTDSYRGKKYEGRVSFISQQTEFTPKYIQTTEERVKYVYRIKVKADNTSLDLKPGMPADALIQIE